MTWRFALDPNAPIWEQNGMALGSSDERDLLLPIFSGIQEQPLWDTFLRRLLARTGARRLCLMLRPAHASSPVLQRIVVAPNADSRTHFDIEELSDSGLLPYASLRPQRVYSLQEFFALDDAALAERQRELLEKSNIAHARIIRIVARGDRNAWLILLHDRQDFSAADSALLSALAPPLALVIAMLADGETLRLRAAMAEDALALIGVGQAAFDAEGHVILADGLASDQLDLQASGRPRLRAQEAQALHTACASLASASGPARQLVRIDERQGRDMLLRPAAITGNGTAAIGIVRQPRRENGNSAARVIAATLGLSLREAALAEAISQGQSIVEAGAGLQLTPETARNYSKRIYAKTGASGQADLVRLLLTGLAPFA
jgi:DNA-binding CsgD family transcriptional regulator